MLEPLWIACYHLVQTVRTWIYTFILSPLLPWSLCPSFTTPGQPHPLKCVLVTGASTGIGAHLALHLAERGYTCFATVRKPSDGERLQDEFQRRSHAVPSSSSSIAGNLIPLRMDVTDPKSIHSARDEIEQHMHQLWNLYPLLARDTPPRLVALVNNAGTCLTLPLELTPLAELDSVLKTNVNGVMAVTQVFLPLLRDGLKRPTQTEALTEPGRRRRLHLCGRVILVGSLNGRVSVPTMGAYCASKHALEAVADTLRLELLPQRISVSLIEPGSVKTPLFEKTTQMSMDAYATLTEDQQWVSRHYYTRLIRAMQRLSPLLKQSGTNVCYTTLKMEHAIENAFPQTRYSVGLDASLLPLVKSIVPDRVFDFMIGHALFGWLALSDYWQSLWSSSSTGGKKE